MNEILIAECSVALFHFENFRDFFHLTDSFLSTPMMAVVIQAYIKQIKQ